MTSIKSLLLARLPWIHYLLSYFLIRMLCFFPGFYRRVSRTAEQKCCLAIEAGTQGWNAIEFKELYQSGIEYLGQNAVKKIEINKSNSYVMQVEAALLDPTVTHYLYDPRTGRQDFWGGFYESVRIAILLTRYRVIPVVYLTDLSFRKWRCQSSAVSALSGVVVTFMMPKRVQPIFPHRRLVGPSLMPISNETHNALQRLRQELEITNSIKPVVRFTGSLYEPRTSFLKSFSDQLSKYGHKFELLGRELGSARVTDIEYWTRLSSAAIVITTADQAVQSGTDWTWIPHLVYRYLEVLASGSLLLASPVPGISRYFEPGIHFVSYDSLEDAVIKARYYLDHPHEAEKIRVAGQEKATILIRMHSFWVQVDTALGSESFAS